MASGPLVQSVTPVAVVVGMVGILVGILVGPAVGRASAATTPSVQEVPGTAAGEATTPDAPALPTDVDSLRAWIDRIHPRPYRFHPAATFDSAAADLKTRSGDLPAAHFALEVHGLLALLNDGHSEFASLPESLRGPGLRLFIRRFAEGWFVTTGHTDHADLFGRPIVSIGGVPMDELVRRLAPYVPADNPMDRLDAIGNFLRNGRVLDFLGVDAATDGSVDVVVVQPDGSRRPVPVEVHPQVGIGAGWTDVEKYLNPDVPEPLFRALDANYACRYLPRERAVYLSFSEVRDDESTEPIAEFFPRALAFAEQSDAERLILDIRENGGGNLDLNGPIVRAILRSPFDRPGRLFVIIGNDTFSAAMHLAVTLERLAHPIFVGVPTAGRPNSPGDTRSMTLPVSGLEVEISELFWQQSDPRDERPWITPDVPATPSMRDRLDGRDGALEAALAYEVGPAEQAEFGRTMQRWQRPSQRRAASWPEMLEPAATPVDPEARPPEPGAGIGPAEACEPSG